MTKEKKRSILENPKSDQRVLLDPDIKDGLLSKGWRSRVVDFYKSIIPSHSKPQNQLWLKTPQDVAGFCEKLNSDDCDLSSLNYICICDTIADIYDIVDFLNKLHIKLPNRAKIIYLNYNWKLTFLFRLSGLLGFSRNRKFGDFYRDKDLDDFFQIAGWENVKRIRRYMLPIRVPILSIFFDNLLVRLPILNILALNTFFVARKSHIKETREHSVSVLVPCKNEEGNIAAIVERMPDFSSHLEIVFINDKSSDGTEKKIIDVQATSQRSITLVHGAGNGKKAAVAEGVKHACGDICMILDADLTVIPEDLPQFYEALKSHRADFVHGTRFVYRYESGAFRFANIIGNMFFSAIFSYIVDQRMTDTLCGTKAFWRSDWPLFEETRLILGDRDLWGDYNLIFGASRYGLKIAQLPVRYFERLQGVTKMNKRIRNGLVMFRVACEALWKIKFINE
ncbi:MAG: glycosyltransferase family 2 protein [Candidatus Omnitrophica bacterium]|nr:glycosyltransferase family 2 protein [Candidatus Omnitrophota bacterium]